MKRRDLVKLAAAPIAVGLPLNLSPVARACDQAVAVTRTAGMATRDFRLSLQGRDRRLLCRLEHLSSGLLLTDEAYSYSFGTPSFDSIREEPGSMTLKGQTDTGIGIEHHFTAGGEGTWIEERIRITNLGQTTLDLSRERCGFALAIPTVKGQPDTMFAQDSLSAIPFLREFTVKSTTRYAEYSLADVFSHECRSGLLFAPSSNFGAEGWAWRRGDQNFLITKYSQVGMEWAVLDSTPLSGDRVALRWGGFGAHDGHPGHGVRLRPGESHQFGVTRLTAIKGNRDQAFYAFRAEMTARGHGCPKSFNPPVHWNELYDNKLVSLGGSRWVDDPEMKRKYFLLSDMKQAAEKAKAYHCEALYLDPGWDTNFASKYWDESRLGTLGSFVSMLASDYGLNCSLHTSLSGWCNPTSYTSESYRLDRFGRRAEWDPKADVGGLVFNFSPICGASRQYTEETARRLKVLTREGVAFFMFDGTSYIEECWDPTHGHDVPARVEAHAAATVRLARLMHEDYPALLIEMHDPVKAGGRYTPVYFGHGHCSDPSEPCGAAGFDSVWAFELMWKPMEDLLSGRSIALYYYNLAYALPLYIHIDLRSDNENALVFWWNASTCRHLGIGGTHSDPATVAAHREAMRTYRRLKPYFASGVFYGIDEQTHVHSAPDGKSAVLNCFNLSDQAVEREILFEPANFGLEPDQHYRFAGAHTRKAGEIYTATPKIPALGHTLIEVQQHS